MTRTLPRTRPSTARSRRRPRTDFQLGSRAAQDLKIVETDQLQVVYFDPSGSHLAPYVTQSFLNSLNAQKARFGYEPDGKVTVLLQDFARPWQRDGHPRCAAQPDLHRRRAARAVVRDVQPGRAVYTLSNHELVHTVVGDQASAGDLTARRWLGGKVAPAAEHPEIDLLQLPDQSARVVATLVPGGQRGFHGDLVRRRPGRAQGGYDEMVFRAMVRDGAEFYDPLGLVSKGTEVDFQIGGQRVSLRHALHELPRHGVHARKADRLAAARGRHRELLHARFRTRVRQVPRGRLAGLDPLGARLSAGEPDAVRSIPSRPTRKLPGADSAPSPAPT